MTVPDLEEPQTKPANRMAEHDFDILRAESPSFASLEQARESVFASRKRMEAFQKAVAALGTEGDEGRRKGLAHWVLADYAGCADALAAHESDPTAAYTRVRALLSLHRNEEAEELARRLAEKYPDEPRPRAAWLEAKIEHGIERGTDPETLSQEVEEAIRSAEGFVDGVEGRYVAGRAAELRRDWQAALDHYGEGHEIDGSHRGLLFRFAHLAERCGLDELAIQIYEELLVMQPTDRRVLMNLGVLYEDAGRDADAAACYDTVAANDGTDVRARLFLEDAKAALSMFYDEDLEKKEDRLNQILRIPITDFELSVRARNCLNKMQITTLGDLVQRTEQELLSYKNFGETSLTEIKEILHSKGLRLGMPREEAVASIEAHASRLATGDRADVLNKPILELNLSIRARRTVETLGCLTLGDVTKHSAEELLGMPNFGQTSLQELRSKLAEYGLKLKGE